MGPNDLADDTSADCCPTAPLAAHVFPPDLEAQARLFKALGDEGRLKLLSLVYEREVCVCDLVDVMGMAQGTLSHHLNVLLQAGLVSVRKQGRWNYYQATALGKGPLAVFAAHPVAHAR